MRWPNLLCALAMHGANCQADQPEVPIYLMARSYWIGFA